MDPYEVQQLRQEMEDELSALVEKLGCGGWRIENGILPQIILTKREAETILERLEKGPQG